MTQDRSGLEFRRALPDDLASEYQVFGVAQAAHWARSRLEWKPPDEQRWLQTHRHLLAQDGGRSFVATKDGDAVGFTAAFVREDTWFFSALFVLPEFQAHGLGKELFALAWGDDYRRRITITDAIQPASNVLYARRGLIPTAPILHLSGISACAEPERAAATSVEAEALTALDRAAYGFDRSVDHRFWSARAKATLWLADDEPIAYSYVGPDGKLGPLAGRDGKSAALALRGELARRVGCETTLAIPGTARELVMTALACGLRFSQPPGLLLLSRSCSAPNALAISDYWLY